MKLSKDNEYQALLGRISQIYTKGRLRAYQAIDQQMTETYWKTGHDIVEYEQGGKAKATYGKALITNLSRDLTPYVFEFLKIPEAHLTSENQLETLLCDHLQSFLLELGKGFTFVGRQYRITINNTHYRVDLVFYHRILRCFVLLDLKLDDVQHHDIGQMRVSFAWH